ncbi:MAG: DUF2244 domain-containing protein [Pseudomonadota bacterium]
MPYRWTEPNAETTPAELRLWPHQSMTPEGFVGFMGATLTLIALPLMTLLGSPILWVVLAFFAVTIWGLWFAIDRQRKRASLTELLTLGMDEMTLTRTEPSGVERQWQANPYWVSVHLHSTGGPVENYLTLRGGDREVELGAFLSPEERVDLYEDMCARLREMR